MKVIFILIFTIFAKLLIALDSLAPQSLELDQSYPPYSRQPPLYPPRKFYKNLYDEVVINDPQPQSAGAYIRLSQKGANYFTELIAEGLPSLLTKIVLPTVDLAAFKGENFVITKFEKPTIKATFVNGTGVNFIILLPHVEVEGDCKVDLLFTAESHMLAVMKNWTIKMDVNIFREIGDEKNTVNLSV
uniref:Uncharacterized protein n=1 Tax=Panagrolaimus davidi TaxID=227884 RepID=A0A914PB52_9BILA